MDSSFLSTLKNNFLPFSFWLLWLLCWMHLVTLHSFTWDHSSIGSFGMDACLSKGPILLGPPYLVYG